MSLGIIGAMDEEIEKLKQVLVLEDEIKIANYVFFKGKIYNKNVVIVKSSEGKVNSAMCTQTLLLNFNIDRVINVGVAGGVDDKLNVGAIAISKNTVEYDFDTTALGYELGFTFGLNKVYIECDKSIYEKICEISRNEFNTLLGTIGSSDKFISDESDKLYLKQKFNLIAVDMETACINHVCRLNNVPFCAIRAISDTKSALEYKEFLELATENLYKVVINYIKSI